MRYETSLVDLGNRGPYLAGRALGDAVYREVIKPVASKAAEHTLLVLSFRGVEFATGSFFKATWLPLHPTNEVSTPSMVAHLSDDVRTEFDIFLMSQRLAGLEALDWTQEGVSLARLHGHLEAPALGALKMLIEHPGSTAPELYKQSKEQVSATAWTNRLNDLHRQGLALRGSKSRRAWRFHPVAKEVEHG